MTNLSKENTKRKCTVDVTECAFSRRTPREPKAKLRQGYTIKYFHIDLCIAATIELVKLAKDERPALAQDEEYAIHSFSVDIPVLTGVNIGKTVRVEPITLTEAFDAIVIGLGAHARNGETCPINAAYDLLSAVALG